MKNQQKEDWLLRLLMTRQDHYVTKSHLFTKVFHLHNLNPNGSIKEVAKNTQFYILKMLINLHINGKKNVKV